MDATAGVLVDRCFFNGISKYSPHSSNDERKKSMDSFTRSDWIVVFFTIFFSRLLFLPSLGLLFFFPFHSLVSAIAIKFFRFQFRGEKTKSNINSIRMQPKLKLTQSSYFICGVYFLKFCCTFFVSLFCC